jgi:dUTP diphosphatase
LRAATKTDEPILLPAGGRQAIATGIAIALPSGYEAQIRPRSGLALEHGVTCLNSPGTIDSDYRGEIQVILINFGQSSFTIRRGDRIAQLVIAPVTQANWVETEKLDETKRGTRGFGSSGRR